MSDNVAASAKHEAKLAATVEEHDAALVKLQREMQADAKQLIVSTTQELAEAQEQHQTETAALQAALHAAAEAASSELTALQERHKVTSFAQSAAVATQLSEQKSAHEAQLAEVKAAHEVAISELQAEAEVAAETASTELATVQGVMASALQKAEDNASEHAVELTSADAELAALRIDHATELERQEATLAKQKADGEAALISAVAKQEAKIVVMTDGYMEQLSVMTNSHKVAAQAQADAMATQLNRQALEHEEMLSQVEKEKELLQHAYDAMEAAADTDVEYMETRLQHVKSEAAAAITNAEAGAAAALAKVQHTQAAATLEAGFATAVMNRLRANHAEALENAKENAKQTQELQKKAMEIATQTQMSELTVRLESAEASLASVTASLLRTQARADASATELKAMQNSAEEATRLLTYSQEEARSHQVARELESEKRKKEETKHAALKEKASQLKKLALNFQTQLLESEANKASLEQDLQRLRSAAAKAEAEAARSEELVESQQITVATIEDANAQIHCLLAQNAKLAKSTNNKQRIHYMEKKTEEIKGLMHQKDQLEKKLQGVRAWAKKQNHVDCPVFKGGGMRAAPQQNQQQEALKRVPHNKGFQ